MIQGKGVKSRKGVGGGVAWSPLTIPPLLPTVDWGLSVKIRLGFIPHHPPSPYPPPPHQQLYTCIAVRYNRI